MQNAKDSMFVLVEASKLSLNDIDIWGATETRRQRIFQERLTNAIKSGLSDFWRPKLDPSFNEDKTGIVFEAGKMPAVGKSYNWWEDKAKQYLPERGSRLGTRNEYVAFLGVLIKNLIKRGWSSSQAWKAVCDNSEELGIYWNSSPRDDFATTGSRGKCGFCDLANTWKMLAGDTELDGYWIAGGCYGNYSFYSPLANHLQYIPRDDDYNYSYSVGWLVLSK